MPYIGKNPVGGGFHKLDNLTASATATYALTLGSAAYYPESANQLLVSLNGVIQAPQDSFTVSGSNLVFDTALTASDSIDFVVALGDVLAVKTVTDGAITKAKMGTTELDLATIKDSTGTNTAMTIDSNGVITQPAKPMFRATGADNVSLTNNTFTKIQFNSEDFDIGGYYDHSTNYRFTPLVAGKYQVGMRVFLTYGSAATENISAELRKNGSAYQTDSRLSGNNTTYGTVQISTVVDMNGSTDYLEAFCKGDDSTDASYYSSSNYGEFFAYLIG